MLFSGRFKLPVCQFAIHTRNFFTCRKAFFFSKEQIVEILSYDYELENTAKDCMCDVIMYNEYGEKTSSLVKVNFCISFNLEQNNCW